MAITPVDSMGGLVVGGFGGTVFHNMVEAFFDRYYQGTGAEDYLVKSTLTTIAIVGLTAGTLIYLARIGRVSPFIGVLAVGMLLAEIPQFVDMVRVHVGLQG